MSLLLQTTSNSYGVKIQIGGFTMKTHSMERKNIWLVAGLLIAAVMAVVMVFNVQTASANDTFDITVKHGINGTSLGLDKDLPVDVYINGGYAFTFSFKDVVSTSLPADEYTIMVKLAGTDTVVMSLGPVDIPAGVDVGIRAKLSADKTPTLKVQVE
jgi:hypothetical protein